MLHCCPTEPFTFFYISIIIFRQCIWIPYIFAIVAPQVGLDASSSTAFRCMFFDSWWSGNMTLILLANHCTYIVFFFFSLTLIVFAGSLSIGKKDAMFLKGFWLIQIGQSTMGTGYGFRVHHSFTRYEAYMFSVIYKFSYWCLLLVGSDYHPNFNP